MEEICLNFDITNYIKDNAGVKEFNYSLDYKGSIECYKEILLENFKVGYGCCLRKKNSLPCKVVTMYFVLGGDSKKLVKKLQNSFLFCSNEHNIFYTGGDDVLSLCSENSQVFEVSLNPNFFKKYLPDLNLFNDFREQMHKDRACFIRTCNYPITPEMHFVIREVIKCEWKGHYRKLFLESKVLKLLMLQMKQIQDCTGQASSDIDFVDIELMNHARDLVEKRLKNPLTLADLAKQVGTNECTLKKGFKKVFGTTVFGYIQDIRMHKAKELLLEQKMSVNEVSDCMGYKNPQHFSIAFKKKYGMPPSYLKKGLF